MLTRRDFLTLSALAASGIAARPLLQALPPEDAALPLGLGRVTVAHVRVYSEPTYRSAHFGWLRRDELIPIHAELVSDFGPRHNPLWYRITGGFVHSGYLQRVEAQHLNPIAEYIPRGGALGEVTVPFTQSYRRLLRQGWQRLYRLYYETIHWVTGLVAGPDGDPWYQITDELLHVHYCVPAAHVRLLQAAELAPLSAHLPEEEKWIEVSLEEQTLTAYEAGQPVLQSRVASGVPTGGETGNGIPTDTPRGRFRIALKMPSKHMGDGELTSDLHAYELLGVPWNCFFVATGVAFHGTFWHNNFGTRMSHGCVNMRNQDALWLYRWTTPTVEPDQWHRQGAGTLVIVS
jgi:hypothetical protein